MNKYSRTLKGGCGIICENSSQVDFLIDKVSWDFTITAKMYIDFIKEVNNSKVLITVDEKDLVRCTRCKNYSIDNNIQTIEIDNI